MKMIILISFLLGFLLGNVQYAPNKLKGMLSITTNVPIIPASNSTGKYNEVNDSIILSSGNIIALATDCSSYRGQYCDALIFSLNQNLTIKTESILGALSDEYFSNILELEDTNLAILYNIASDPPTLNIIIINNEFKSIDSFQYSCANLETTSGISSQILKWHCRTTAFVEYKNFYLISFYMENNQADAKIFQITLSFLMRLDFVTRDIQLVKFDNPSDVVSMVNLDNSKAIICSLSSASSLSLGGALQESKFEISYSSGTTPTPLSPSSIGGSFLGYTTQACLKVSKSYNDAIISWVANSGAISGVLISITDQAVIYFSPHQITNNNIKFNSFDMYSYNTSLSGVFSYIDTMTSSCTLIACFYLKIIKCKRDSKNKPFACIISSETSLIQDPFVNRDPIPPTRGIRKTFKSTPLNNSNEVMLYGGIGDYYQSFTTVGFIIKSSIISNNINFDDLSTIIVGGSNRAMLLKVYSTINNYSIVIGQDDENALMIVFDEFFNYACEYRITNKYGVGNIHLVETYPDFIVIAYDLTAIKSPSNPSYTIFPNGTIIYTNPYYGIQIDKLNISLTKFGSSFIPNSMHLYEMIWTSTYEIAIAYLSIISSNVEIIKMNSDLILTTTNISLPGNVNPNYGSLTESLNHNLIFASTFQSTGKETPIVYIISPDLAFSVKKEFPFPFSLRVIGISETSLQNILLTGFLVNENAIGSSTSTTPTKESFQEFMWSSVIDQNWKFLYDNYPVINPLINYFQSFCKIDPDTYVFLGMSSYDPFAYVKEQIVSDRSLAIIQNTTFLQYQSVSKSSFGYYTSCTKYGENSFLAIASTWSQKKKTDFLTGLDQISYEWTCMLPGFYFNKKKGICEEICGDSKNYGAYECDTSDLGCSNCMQVKYSVCYGGDEFNSDTCANTSLFDLNVTFTRFPEFEIISSKPSMPIGRNMEIKFYSSFSSSIFICNYAMQMYNSSYGNVSIPSDCNISCADKMIVNLKPMLYLDNYNSSPIHEIFNLSMIGYKYNYCRNSFYNTSNLSYVYSTFK